MEGMFRPKFVDGRYKHDVFAQGEMWHHFFKYVLVPDGAQCKRKGTLVQKEARKVLDKYRVCKFSIFVQTSADQSFQTDRQTDR